MGGFLEDFDGDFDGGFDDVNDDDFNETFSESEIDDPEIYRPDIPLESENEPGGIRWRDWMIIGPMSEEIAREKVEEERLLRENEKVSENDD